MHDKLKYLRVREVAEVSGFTPDRIAQFLRQGRLRGVRPAGPRGSWRIPVDAVREFLGEQRTEATA